MSAAEIRLRKFLIPGGAGGAALLLGAILIRTDLAGVPVRETRDSQPAVEERKPEPPPRAERPARRTLSGLPARRVDGVRTDRESPAGSEAPGARLAAEAVLVGRVLDWPGGCPIHGARVFLGPASPTSGFPNREPPEIEGGRGQTPPAATTDENGSFAILPIPPKGRILVEAEGRLSIEASYGREDLDRGLRLSLPRSDELPRIEGRVQGQDGRPAPKVEVLLSPVAAEEPRFSETLDGLGRRPARCRGQRSETLTEEDGRFEFVVVPKGIWRVEARSGSARAMATVSIGGGESRGVELRLAEGCRLRGRLVDTRGASISANVYVQSGRTLRGLTSRDGGFEIGDFPSGDRVSVHATMGSLRSATVRVALGRPGEVRDMVPLVLRP